MYNPTLVLVALALTQCATAHYMLTIPPTRGMIEEQEPTAPCGNFNKVQSPRTPWPIGLDLKIVAFHPNANFTTYLSLKEAPSAVGDFQPISNIFLGNIGNHTVPYPLTAIPANSATALGVQPDGSSLVGKSGTIMTIYDAGDGVLYQCGDVTFQASGNNTGAPPSSSQGSGASTSARVGAAGIIVAAAAVFAL